MLLSVDLDKDAGVTAAHDEQRDNVESDKVEHVVNRLLPSLVETPMCHALSEIHLFGFDCSEDEQLKRRDKRLRPDADGIFTSSYYETKGFVFCKNPQNQRIQIVALMVSIHYNPFYLTLHIDHH